MQIAQLEAVREIARNGYNMSLAAETLKRSQPGISRQIKELEHELGIRIFARTRNNIVALTPQGEEVLRIGRRILSDAENLRHIGSWETPDSTGELKIATTHVQARYALPGVIKAFTIRFPRVVLTLQQGDPVQCCNAVESGEADLAITTVGERQLDKVVAVPAFNLSSALFVPRRHPLVREKVLTLKKLAEHPFVAYSPAFAVRMHVDETFARAGLRPHVVCSATDADVCKTYVAAGMGIAVLARIAFDPERDRTLVPLDVAKLFKPSILSIVFKKNGYLSRPMHSFVSMVAPHLTQNEIRRALDGSQPGALRMIADLPRI